LKQKESGADPILAETYLKGVIDLLAEIRDNQIENILKASQIVADAISSGRWIHVFGTGHSHMMADEVSGRAGGLAAFNGIIDLSLSSYSGMIVVSNSGVNAAPVEIAIEAKKRGLRIVAITSVAHSKSVPPRNSSGKKLYEVADVTIDNCGILGDSSVKLEGMEQRVGPTSTVAGASIINAIVTQAAKLLIEKGIKPPVWVSGNIPGSEAINLTYMQKYRRTDRLP
jgi:uncharacterized phosphosugar-binding protein